MKMFREKESGNRNRLEIIADILEIAKEGQLKNRILYDWNLNFSQLNEYLVFMNLKRDILYRYNMPGLL